MDGLTEKQSRFVDAFIETGNATKAAEIAGYGGKNLNRIGSENLSKLDSYIQKRLAEKEDARIAKQDEVLRTLTGVLRREAMETVVVTCKTKRSYYDDKGKKITEESEVPQAVEIPTRVSDVNKAADLLGRRYRLWSETEAGAAPVTVVVKYDYGDGGG